MTQATLLKYMSFILHLLRSLALEESDYSWNEDTLPAAKKDKLTVAVVCVDKSGHMLPVLYICGELAKRGHRVRVHVPGYGQNEFEKLLGKTHCFLSSFSSSLQTIEGRFQTRPASLQEGEAGWSGVRPFGHAGLHQRKHRKLSKGFWQNNIFVAGGSHDSSSEKRIHQMSPST